jgi:hypothetical protein
MNTIGNNQIRVRVSMNLKRHVFKEMPAFWPASLRFYAVGGQSAPRVIGTMARRDPWVTRAHAVPRAAS